MVSCLDKLRINKYHKAFREFLQGYQHYNEKHCDIRVCTGAVLPEVSSHAYQQWQLIVIACLLITVHCWQDASVGQRCSPVWVYLWKTTFTHEFPMLESGVCSREIGGQPVLTAHCSQNVVEAEKRTPLSVLCPKFVAEHEHPKAKKNRDSVMLANGFT